MLKIIAILFDHLDALIFLGAILVIALENFAKWRRANAERRRRKEVEERERGFTNAEQEPDFVPKEPQAPQVQQDSQKRLRELLREYEQNQGEAPEEPPDITEEELLEDYEERTESAEEEALDPDSIWKEFYDEAERENEQLASKIMKLEAANRELELKLGQVQAKLDGISEAERKAEQASRSLRDVSEKEPLLQRAERGVVWAKVLDEPRFKRPWRANVR